MSKMLLPQQKLAEVEKINREVVAELIKTVDTTYRKTLIQKSTLIIILHEQKQDIEAEKLN